MNDWLLYEGSQIILTTMLLLELCLGVTIGWLLGKYRHHS